MLIGVVLSRESALCKCSTQNNVILIRLHLFGKQILVCPLGLLLREGRTEE